MVVIVPVYRALLTAEETVSLRRTCDVLGRKRPIVVIKPEGLDLSALAEAYPVLRFEEFGSDYFRGIRGYNRLMTSKEFYERFTAYEYLLIAQLDAYIFRDELDEWCGRGYDYVGAPWMRRPQYSVPPCSWIRARKDRRRVARGLFAIASLFGRVGNGGLSLRKVRSHIARIEENQEYLAELNRVGMNGWPEDVFWAFRKEFRYPTAKEALMFSYDLYPRYCHWVNRHRLPMGCHAWFSRKSHKFWRGIIPVE